MLLKSNHIILETDIMINETKIYTAMQSEIELILINILQNAINSLNKKYGNKNKNKRLEVKASLLNANRKEFLNISIKDLGTGISKDIENFIFEPFFSTLPKNFAKGLGLTFSKKIINEYGGSITFDSVEGEYTTFYIKLPLNLKDKINQQQDAFTKQTMTKQKYKEIICVRH